MASFSFTRFLVTFQLTVLTLASASVTMPPECKNMNYCTSNNNYPEAAIRKLNAQSQLPNMLQATKGTHDYTHRISEDPSDKTRSMCPINHRTSSDGEIYYIVDRQNQTRVVVQLSGVLEQRFGVRKCSKPGNVQRPAGPAITLKDLKKYQFYCENIYYHYEFLVLSMDQTRIEKAYSQEPGIPVHCACKYRNSEKTMEELE